jgi:hypothetical protein
MTFTLGTETRTAGQHEPVPELIQPYSAFPKKVTGPTVWQAEEFRAQPERWQRKWTLELIQDLEDAYAAFEKSGKPITAITKVSGIVLQR